MRGCRRAPAGGRAGGHALLTCAPFSPHLTVMIPETKGRTLEELNGEDGSTPSFFNVDVAAAISKEQEEAAKANHAAAVAART